MGNFNPNYFDRKSGSLEEAIRGAVNEKSIKEGFSPKEVKMAIGIAADPRYKGGNMTGAVKAIEKIKNGLSDDPKVAAVLKKMNEGSKEEYQKFFNATLKKFKIDSPADLKSDEEKKKFFNYIDKNYTGEKDEAYIASMKETKKWAGLQEAMKGFKVEFGKGNDAGMALYKDKKDADAFAKRQPKPVKITQIDVKNANMFDDPAPTRKEAYDIGTPENTKSKLDATPGQSADDWKRQVEVIHKKQASMREALAKVWGVDEGRNPFTEVDFKPHMMYDPKTGKGYKADTKDDHLRMKKMGYTHDEPKKEQNTMTGKPMTKIKVDPDMKEKNDK
tara:strand:- start:576 stop:1571 length:996 start_codon:yes stop_codon:yes gene_type:complete